MYYSLVCLMTRNLSLTPSVRMDLVNTAKQMFQAGRTTQKIKCPNVEGRLQTKWEEACLGTFAGIKFQADLETDLGRGKMEFIVAEAELELEEILDSENSDWVNFEGSPQTRRDKAVFN